MIQYPLYFQSTARAPNGMQTTWQSGPAGSDFHCSIPKEFDGPGGALSPEDLYLAALSNCFVATYKVYAEHSKLQFDSLSVNSKLTVDLDERKKPVMKEVDFTIIITGASNPERARLLAKKASESGFVLNSVKSKLNFSFEIS